MDVELYRKGYTYTLRYKRERLKGRKGLCFTGSRASRPLRDAESERSDQQQGIRVKLNVL